MFYKPGAAGGRNKRVVLPAWVRCPDCGRVIRDPDYARLGYCDHCRDFTAMCGAGRRIVCPDVMTNTTWHMPCTLLGAAAWDISVGAGRRRTLLCPAHEADIRSGAMPWIAAAVPVAR